MNFLENILTDISNFTLVIFGFCATLYTVIYSFILTKKDSLNEIAELLKLGERVPLHTLKEISYSNYIIRMRRFNSYIIICLWSSLIIYTFSLLIKYFKLYKLPIKYEGQQILEGYLVYIILFFTILLFVIIVILILKSLGTYKSTTKI